MMLNLDGITIRPAEDSELPLIKELARQIWPETYGKILSPAQIDYMIEIMYALPVLQRERREEGISFDLICDGERPAGFLSCGPYRKEPPTMKQSFGLPSSSRASSSLERDLPSTQSATV